MWDLNDVRTWRDPYGETKEPPMEEQDSFYLQVWLKLHVCEPHKQVKGFLLSPAS
jgi:hypothetical protein